MIFIWSKQIIGGDAFIITFMYVFHRGNNIFILKIMN